MDYERDPDPERDPPTLIRPRRSGPPIGEQSWRQSVADHRVYERARDRWWHRIWPWNRKTGGDDADGE